MTKFNKPKRTAGKTVNYEGAPAYKYPPKLELALRCATHFFEDTFYAPKHEITEAIKNLVLEVGAKDPEFVLKLAAWLRHELGMRTAPQFLLAVMAGHPAHECAPKPWVAKWGPVIMARADEPAEVLAIYKEVYGGPIPMALRRAIAKRLQALTPYEIIKYRGKTREWSLVDVLNVIHPKPKDAAQAAAFKWVVTGEIGEDTPEEIKAHVEGKATTWESLISAYGSNHETWMRAAEIMPPMAYIRNLCNLLKHNVPIDREKILAAARHPKIMPFRFLAALASVQHLEGENISLAAKQEAEDALIDAIEIATDNVPSLGRVGVLVDTSGSMLGFLSARSMGSRVDVARLFAAAAFKKAQSGVIISYGTGAQQCKVSRSSRTYDIFKQIYVDGGGTNLAEAIEKVAAYANQLDYVVILTDEQSWLPGGWGYAGEAIKKLLGLNPELRVVNVCLAPYGTSDLPQNPRILDIGGFNDNIFKIILVWDKLVDVIENWEGPEGPALE